MLIPHAIAVTVPPTATPVSLSELKAHLLVEHSLDDSLLTALLAAATEHAERDAAVYLMPQTVAVTFRARDFARLCGSEALDLPVYPLRSVSSVAYLDADGASQTWGSGDWQAWTAHRPALLAPAYGEPWPTVRSGALAAVTVTCAVGAANAAAVPDAAKHAVKLIASHLYANKGDGRDPTGEMGIPPAAKRFLDFLRQDFYR